MKDRFALSKKRMRSVPPQRSFDIHPEHQRPPVISLRPKEPSSFTLVYRDMRALAARNRRGIFALVVLLAVGIALGTYRIVTHADTAILYPSSCLGGWKNATNAEGKPDLSLSAEPNDFSAENSAVLAADTSGEIFCGGFSGAIPAESKPTKILLSLVWTGGTPTAVITGDSFASSTQEILDSVGSAPDFKLTEPVARPPLDSGQVPAAEPTPAAAPELPPAAESAPAPAADTSPVSFLQRYLILPIAYAQENSATNATPSETPTPPPAPEINAIPEPAVSNEPATASTATTTTETNSSTTITSAPVDTTPHSSTNDFVEVRYTLNGTDWTSLGTFDTAHIAQSTFEIPVPSSAKWNDLSSLQISVRSIPSSDAKPVLYLDGMRLAIEYDPGDQKFYADKPAYTLADIITLTSVQSRSAVEIYSLTSSENEEDASNVYATIVGDEGRVKIDAYTLLPGNYIFVNTTDKFECNTFSLIQCRSAGGYIDEIPVTVVSRAEDLPARTTTSTTVIVPATSSSPGTTTPVEIPAPAPANVVPLPSQDHEVTQTP